MIIGVDPGDTVGFAVWTGLTFTSGQLSSDDAAAVIGQWIEPGTIIACERFVIGSRTHRRRHSTATDLVGALRDRCVEVGARFVLQSASDAKSLATNELLQRVGWFTRGMRHANDAARHCLLAVARTNPAAFDRMVSVDEHA